MIFAAARLSPRSLCITNNICCLRLHSSQLSASKTLRYFASKADSNSPKPKPKATTPLRRDARASLPIRANPTPTRGAIQQIVTVCTAERYSLPALRSRLPPQAQALQESWWVPKWGKDEQGEVFVFSNGSVVCWGGNESECASAAQAFIDQVLRAKGAVAEIGQLQEEETEEL